jgi:DNA topoisomerase-1
MRTDSTNLSTLAIGTAKKYILENYGEDYLHSRQYRTKSKGAQEAHEAIRPTYIDRAEIEGTTQEKKLYDLIWKRTLASQMAESRVMNTTLKVASDKRPERYGVQAAELLFDGFMKVYREGRDDEADAADEEVLLPQLHPGDVLVEKGISALCKFTVPPMRYSQATLVKKLEELGIGRPSTYVPTVETLTRGRGYAVMGDKEGQVFKVTNYTLSGGTIRSSQKNEVVGAEKGKLLPQEIGVIVTNYLVEHFKDILDYDFTATVETDFDEVAEGKKQWRDAPFHSHVENVLAERNYSKVSRELGFAPDGQKVIAAFGKFGAYVQKGDGDTRQSASLGKGQLIETLTLEEALKLLELPRTVGQLNGVDIVAVKGRFGPYLKYGDKNVRLPRNADPLTISLETCIGLVQEAETEKPAAVFLAEFGDIKVVNGRYGPYIKKGDSNYKIPKGMDAATLTESDCQSIINNTEPTTKFRKRGKN